MLRWIVELIILQRIGELFMTAIPSVSTTTPPSILSQVANSSDLESRTSAAVNIQRVFRGHLVRQAMQDYLHDLSGQYHHMRSNASPITDGYGEFLVYQRTEESGRRPIPKELYDVVYETIRQSPPVGSFQSRSSYIRGELQKINPGLAVVFLPRTLYDLIYVKASIDEEVHKKSICSLQYDGVIEGLRKDKPGELLQIAKDCWHVCKFTDKSGPGDDEDLLRILSFRLNELALKEIPVVQFLTGSQIIDCTERTLAFFKSHQETFPDRYYAGAFNAHCGARGGAINFGLTRSMGCRTICYSMGIGNENDAQIVRNAIALECSKAAQNALILYRAEENNKRGELPDTTQASLSYGTSLFAGAFFDGTACVFHYTIDKARDTYAVVVPLADSSSPFFIPRSHPIMQLFSVGEYFHSRSVLSSEAQRGEYIRGIFSSPDRIPDALYSNFNAATLRAKLQKYHSKAVSLTPSDRSADRAAVRARDGCSVM